MMHCSASKLGDCLLCNLLVKYYTQYHFTMLCKRIQTPGYGRVCRKGDFDIQIGKGIHIFENIFHFYPLLGGT